MQESITQFDRYLRAKYPIIALVSHEESRVEKELTLLLKQRSRRMYTWTITGGLKNAKIGPDPDSAAYRFDAESTRDPISALRAILESPRTESTPPTVFLLKDMHRYMTDPVLVRLLRDVVVHFEAGNNTIVLLSPEFQTPADLEKSVVVVDWNLPNEKHLATILKRVEKSTEGACRNSLNGDRADVVQALRGLTAFEAESVLLSAIVATGELSDKLIPFIITEKRQIIRKSGVLEFYEETATMDDIGGLRHLKTYATEARETFLEQASDWGLEPAKGVLLLGIPGVGKSLSAKAMAGGKLPLLRLDVGAVMGSLVGQSEANIRQALRVTEAVSPCVLWIDEIEKALGSQGGEHDGGTSSRVFGTLLTWMQETRFPVYIVATANDVRNLKPELLRRFDDILFVDLPCHEDRVSVLEIHLVRRKQGIGNFDIDLIASACRGFTGAELEKVVKTGLKRAFVERRPMTTADLLAASRSVIPIATTMKEQINELRAWAKDRAIQAADPLEDEVNLGEKFRSIEL